MTTALYWAGLCLRRREDARPCATQESIIGMLSREDVITFLGMLQELGA